MQIQRVIISSVILLFPMLHVFSQQGTNRNYWTYIDQYKELAMEQQQKYKIPASITLAQGLLESGAGRSTLATEANNHFGIKVSGGWTGPYVVRDDDYKGEHFRKYKDVRDSFEDHSLFLLKPRYRVLFTYETNDYRSWARGLKQCGYATNPAYADGLIRIIESYSLYQFDTMIPGQRTEESQILMRHAEKRNEVNPEKFYKSHMVYAANRNYFIIVQRGDNLATISRETGVSIKRLLRYNDLGNDYTLTIGDVLYLEQKHDEADPQLIINTHRVEQGQSMHDISQLYGIRLKSLYKLNRLDPSRYVPRIGDVLYLR
ncbi:MAG: glucosaminidase domain-containing protein [Bacteroidaceae bacterium]|nr:glucosaminidase domain-containing protein [Bacteroidaceae bacterium]